MKATKDKHLDISELREEANTRLLHASVDEKYSQYIFSFSYCNFPIIDKQEATNEIFLTCQIGI